MLYQGSTDTLVASVVKEVQISYNDGDKLHTIKAAKGHDLQRSIDRLRSEKKEILSIAEVKPSFEETFVNMALKTGKES